jgi:hypothetical protein
VSPAGRFPPEVADVLDAHGWHDGRQVSKATTARRVSTVCGLVGRRGQRHEPFPAALDALGEFGGLYVDQDGPGRDLRRRPFAIDPEMAAASAETLADFARVIGVRLFPLGVEGDGEALLAVDERGRVFALDHAGEWLLGETVDEALTTLVTGVQPHRVRDDGTV